MLGTVSLSLCVLLSVGAELGVIFGLSLVGSKRSTLGGISIVNGKVCTRLRYWRVHHRYWRNYREAPANSPLYAEYNAGHNGFLTADHSAVQSLQAVQHCRKQHFIKHIGLGEQALNARLNPKLTGTKTLVVAFIVV